ncbi:hypothetical protein JCM10213_005574 [Rhodosporidiobolus nylandii]
MASHFPYASTSTQPWPTFLPPVLKALSDPRPHPDPSSLPASRRYKGKHATLQDEIDELEQEEDDYWNGTAEVRHYGYSWLVPLGRQHTHDEDAESAFTASPRHDPNSTFDSALGAQILPPGAGGGAHEQQQPADEAPVRDLDADIEDADTSGSSGGGSEVGRGTPARRGGDDEDLQRRVPASPASEDGGFGGSGSEAGEESMQM